MFFRNREETLAGLYAIGSSRCSYTWDAKQWLNTRCDCKYGYDGDPAKERIGSEENGCPELRSIYKVIEAMTDEEWDLLLHRSGGVRIS